MSQRFIGRYRVVRSLGRGGMGEVFEAFDDQLDRPVAIKGLASSKTDPAQRERLRLEALATASVPHPSIAHVYEIVREEDRDWLVMEFIPGHTLASSLRSGPLPVDDVLRIGGDVARALAAAHERGIVHRDIKTENVMITPEGHVKVLDFGVAKRLVVGGSGERPLTAEGTVLGTSRAMSPEQALGHEVDSRSDLFSLGSLLYEMTAGVPAFLGRTRNEIMVRVARAEYRPLKHAAPHAPEPLANLIARCLAADPGDRPQSAAEVAAELSRLRGILATETQLLPGVAPARGILSRRRALVSVGVALVAVALVAIGRWWVFPPLDRVPIAVLPATVSTTRHDRLLGLAVDDAIHAALAGNRRVEIVPAKELAGNLNTSMPAAAIARSVGAREILETSITIASDGTTARITLTRVSGRDGTIRWSGDIDASTRPLMSLEAKVIQLADRAFGDLGQRDRGAPRELTEDALVDYLTARSELSSTLQPAGLEAVVTRLRRACELAPRWLAPLAEQASVELLEFQQSGEAAHLDDARKLLEQAERIAPESREVALAKVSLAIGAGSADEACRLAKSLVDATGGTSAAWRTYGDALLSAKKFDDARRAYGRAMAARPSWLIPAREADLDLAALDPGAAREALARARELAPDNPNLLVGSLRIAVDSGKLGQAEADARALLAADPSAGNALLLADVLLDLRRPEAARDTLMPIVGRNEGDARVMAELAAALLATNATAEAKTMAGRAVAVCGGDAPSLGRIACLRASALGLAVLGRGAEAVLAAHDALSLRPGDPDSAFTVARVAALIGDHSACVTWTARARSLGAPRAWFSRPAFAGFESSPPFQAALNASPSTG